MKRLPRKRQTAQEKMLERIKRLAASVADDSQFEHILTTAQPSYRSQVYTLILPYLRFSPKPFSDMNFESGNA